MPAVSSAPPAWGKTHDFPGKITANRGKPLPLPMIAPSRQLLQQQSIGLALLSAETMHCGRNIVHA